MQASINLFAVLGLAPLTGVPLPFVSYGGTSLIVTLAATGLILNVARRPAAPRRVGDGPADVAGPGRAPSGPRALANSACSTAAPRLGDEELERHEW